MATPCRFTRGAVGDVGAREVILRRRFESLIADFQQKRDQMVTDASTTKASDEPTISRLAELRPEADGETVRLQHHSATLRMNYSTMDF